MKPARPRRPAVLVLRALGLGDALTGVPALRGLRRAFPEHELVLAAPEPIGGWLVRLGLVDRVLPTTGLQPLLARLGDGAPEVAVNLHGRGPQSNRLLLATGPQRLLAFRDDEGGAAEGPPWSADEHEVDRWCRLVRSAGGACDREDLRLTDPGEPAGPSSGSGDDYVVVHPGAASPSRRWPVERWVQVVRWLVQGGRRVVLTGGPPERALCERIGRDFPERVHTTAGALGLDALAAVVTRAGLLVCGDTGVAHLGTAYATPSVLLFGPTPPRLWGPAIDQHLHQVLWPGPPAGHEALGDPHGQTLDPALASITPAEVIDAADQVLARTFHLSRQ